MAKEWKIVLESYHSTDLEYHAIFLSLFGSPTSTLNIRVHPSSEVRIFCRTAARAHFVVINKDAR